MSSMPQIRLRTLLKEDEAFKQWFMKPPTITVVHSTPPWRIFVQMEREGSWARADYRTYAEAFRGVKSRLPEAWDMTIHCKPQGFKPPVLRYQGKKVYAPVPEGHIWCDFCRRATIFGYYSRHRNLGLVSSEEERCGICGTRKSSLPRRSLSPLAWPPRLGK